MKKQNDEVKAYQEARRQETMALIDAAYIQLKESNQTITKAAISRACGISLRTMCKPYVQKHLSKYEEFCVDGLQNTADASSEEIEKLKYENAMLKKKLEKSMKANGQLRESLKISNEKYHAVQHDYECLLGDYQKAGEMKLIRL